MSEAVCGDCGGDGIAVCTNPDHGFYDMLSGTSHGREHKCPCCGYNEDHKIKFFIGFIDGKAQYKTEPCETCNGTGKLMESA